MGFKILIIDDEPILRDSLEIALTASGLRGSNRPDGRGRSGAIPKENPDLVLLDHWLPGINGDGCFAGSRKKTPKSPSSS